MGKTAVVTMQFNEDFFLPRWIEYYGSQVGPRNLYVIDNDSDSAVCEHLSRVSTIRYPRTSFDDQERARFASRFVSSLLELYDTVIFTDCDEFITPDPRKHSGIQAWLDASDFDYATCTGLNVIPLVDEEDSVLRAGPILSQRKHVRFISPMCKMSVVRKPIRWGGGFHHANQRPNFRGLYLFHMKHADIAENLKRQAVTRALSWAHLNQGNHQRLPDLAILKLFVSFVGFPREEWNDDVLKGLTDEFQSKVTESERGGEIGTMFVSPLDQYSKVLFRVPEEFSALF